MIDNKNKSPIKLFYSYAHEDEDEKETLQKHLKILERNHIIKSWNDRKIKPGQQWDQQISHHLEAAQIILLLVSVDFLDSDYCWEVEMTRALERHESGDARVIPILLQKVAFFELTPFAQLQALPKDALPISEWEDPHNAWVNVSEGIMNVCRDMTVPRAPVSSVLMEEKEEVAEVSRDVLPNSPTPMKVSRENNRKQMEVWKNTFKLPEHIQKKASKIVSELKNKKKTQNIFVVREDFLKKVESDLKINILEKFL